MHIDEHQSFGWSRLGDLSEFGETGQTSEARVSRKNHAVDRFAHIVAASAEQACLSPIGQHHGGTIRRTMVNGGIPIVGEKISALDIVGVGVNAGVPWTPGSAQVCARNRRARVEIVDGLIWRQCILVIHRI